MDDELLAKARELTGQIKQRQREIGMLADQRAVIVRRLSKRDGMSTRVLGALLGCSNVAVTFMIHRGEPKPGTQVPDREQEK